MRTFEDEYRELLLWLQKEHERIDALDIPWEGGLDGEKVQRENQVGNEYRKRLKALKEKFHRD